MSEAKGKRPACAITSSFHVWIGNPHDNDGITVEAQELFGFGIGDYDEKEIRGSSLPTRLPLTLCVPRLLNSL